MTDQLIENDQLVDSLRGALRDGETGLEYVPRMLRLVLETEAWRARYDRLGRDEVKFANFAAFATARPTQGLGTSLDLIRRIVADDPVTLDLLDKAVQGRQGSRTDLLDNIQEVVREPAPTGTSQTAALRRLRKDAPELHAQVLAGQLSAHRAMINAGFRKRTATVPVDDPVAAARTIRRQFGREALVQLITALLDPEDG